MGLGDSAERSLHRTVLKAYDVEVIIEADNLEVFERVKNICNEAFVGRLSFEDPDSSKTEFRYRFFTNEDGSVSYDLDGLIDGIFSRDIRSDRFLNSMIRSHIAGRTKNWVFLHAGVVVWKGRAIVIPGQSFQGKTTLVSELIRLGAGYMSDEFAILDEAGMVHPFDRDLAVRFGEERGPESIPPSEFGAHRVTEPTPAGMVLITGFKKNSTWKPTRMTIGNGILAAIPQVIPFSLNTEFALKVLNTTFNRAIIVESDRGEARVTAPEILAYFEESLKFGETASA